jgi:hypothetical protein
MTGIGSRVVATLLLAVGSTLAARAAPPPDLSLAEIVQGSALVVVARVLAQDPPQSRTVTLPGTEISRPAWLRAYHVEVQEVLKGAATPGDRVRLLARSMPPAAAGTVQYTPPGLRLPALEVDAVYVLLLTRLPPSDEWFLPDYFKHYQPASSEHLRAVHAITKRGG